MLEENNPFERTFNLLRFHFIFYFFIKYENNFSGMNLLKISHDFPSRLNL